jgi:hypothetical protein
MGIPVLVDLFVYVNMDLMIQGISEMISNNHIQQPVPVQVTQFRPAGPYKVPLLRIGCILGIEKNVIKFAERTVPVIDVYEVCMGDKNIRLPV